MDSSKHEQRPVRDSSTDEPSHGSVGERAVEKALRAPPMPKGEKREKPKPKKWSGTGGAGSGN